MKADARLWPNHQATVTRHRFQFLAKQPPFIRRRATRKVEDAEVGEATVEADRHPIPKGHWRVGFIWVVNMVLVRQRVGLVAELALAEAEAHLTVAGGVEVERDLGGAERTANAAVE